jgi:F-type H+-transporting ATPase subunit alpha
MLARGERLTELLKQPQYSPLAVEEQVVSVYAGTRGYLDKVPVNAIRRFEEGFLALLKTRYPKFLEGVRTGKTLTPELEATLKEALEGFSATFA